MHCLKKIQPGRKMKEHWFKKYNLEETRKTIVLKNTIWRKQERVLSYNIQHGKNKKEHLNWYILKNRRVLFLLSSRFYFLDNGLTSFFHVVFFKTILFLVSSRLYFLRQCSFFFLPCCIF
jgi:hypothetical protein